MDAASQPFANSSGCPGSLMSGRRSGRGLHPETALGISLHGTALRLVDEGTPTLEAVEQLRAMAGDRVDLLAKEAGGMIGGYLGHPLSSSLALPAAYLLVLAGADKDHAGIVIAADETRRVAGRSAYSS
jgi:hypothetical protein